MTRTLWIALLAGHVAWTAHLLLSYFAASLACAAPAGPGGWSFTPIHVATLAAIALTSVGIAAGRVATLDQVPEHRFVGRLGIAASAVFLFAIALAGIAPLFLSPCA